MIDWTSGKISFKHDPALFNAGSVISIDSDGSKSWETRKRMEVSGSYESKFFLRSEDITSPTEAQSLSFSGNPVKFLQGHNVWGSSDLTGLVYESILKAFKILDLSMSAEETSDLFNGGFSLSRVDINYMYSMGSLDDVVQWLHACEFSARTRQGKGHFSGNTLYFQKRSTRWALKFYSKHLEIKAPGHQLPRALTLGESLIDYTKDKLRCELTLRSKELKKYGLDKGSMWGDNEPYELYMDYMGRLEMSEQKQLDDMLLTLPRTLSSTYTLWKTGYDPKALLPVRTYYRHRKQLLEHGIDISIPSGKTPSNVVPLMRIIEAVPAEIPDWAEGTDLYFEPRKAL